MLQVLELLEQTLEETGKYPPIHQLPQEYQQIIYANPTQFNNLLKASNLPTYYQPPQLPTPQDELKTGPVGRFELPTKEELGTSDLAIRQKMVIKVLLDVHDARTIKAKLSSVGSTTLEYQQWLKDPLFKKKLNSAIDRRFNNLEGEAKLALGKLVLGGDLQAIKYFHEFTGLFRPESETVVNLTKILAQLMEILVRYVEPAQLSEIATEIEAKVLGVTSREIER